MKKTGCLAFPVLLLIVSLVYLSMYLPFWNGKEWILANSGPGIVFFAFQCICVIFAVVCLCFKKIRTSDGCLFTLISAFLLVASLLLTLFIGFFFVLELLSVPWFPAQR